MKFIGSITKVIIASTAYPDNEVFGKETNLRTRLEHILTDKEGTVGGGFYQKEVNNEALVQSLDVDGHVERDGVLPEHLKVSDLQELNDPTNATPYGGVPVDSIFDWNNLTNGTTNSDVPVDYILENLNQYTNATTTVGSPEFQEYICNNNFSLVEPHVKDSPCPLGFICSDDKKANCTILQKTAKPIFGDIHAGLYCPDSASGYKNCPIGHYCPTPETMIPCPSGKFCPHKTATPAISCPSCNEGSKVLVPDFFGWIIVIGIAVCMVVFLIFIAVKRYRKKNFDSFVQATSHSIDSVAIGMRLRESQRRLKRVRPKLDLISRRLKSTSKVSSTGEEDETSTSYDSTYDSTYSISTSNDGAIKYDAAMLFDELDINGDGVLSYEEINTILQLDERQLREFVKRMNRKKDKSTPFNVISRKCFVYYFITVLEETSNFGPTKEEVSEIYDEIVSIRGADNNNMISLDDFYHSPTMTQFLSDPQINSLIRAFRDVLLDTSNARRISKEVFIENYAIFLEKITSPSSMEDKSDKEKKEQKQKDNPAVDIAFEDLCLSIAVGDKTVYAVNNITGRLEAGTMTALLGGSGAGKTSLLNALCGRAFYGTVTGKVYINGHDDASIEEIRGSLGFVPQDDIVYPELTVRENFIYSGRFQLPAGTSSWEIEELADDTLANLGLSRVANSMVGDVKRRGVSGGEKKRVNIGLEIMSRPAAIFLDEPTSGLDSSSAMLVMQSMKNLCVNQGVTLCSVIHQPRKTIFHLFDKIILLGAGGRMVYHGSSEGSIAYFKANNYSLPPGESIADWLIDISSGSLAPGTEEESRKDVDSANGREHNSDLGGEISEPSGNREIKSAEDAKIIREGLYKKWEEHFKSLTDNDRISYSAPKIYPLPLQKIRPSAWVQFWIQFERILIVSRRNGISKLIDMILVVGAVTFICLFQGRVVLTVDHDPEIDFDDITNITSPEAQGSQFGQLFLFSVLPFRSSTMLAAKMLGIVTTVLLCLSATKALTSKRLEFFREAGSGYDINAYFMAVNFTATIEHTVQAILAALFAYWIRKSISSLVAYLVNFILVAWLAVSWSLMIPIFVPLESVVLVTGLVAAVFGFIFSGATESGITYTKIYNEEGAANPFWPQIVIAFLSMPRFFVETAVVNQNRCLPVQTGFTYSEGEAFPPEALFRTYNNTAFGFMKIGHNDQNVTNQSLDGWYWAVLPSIFVGLSLRCFAAGAMHVCDRSKQAKGSILKEKHAFLKIAGYLIILCAIVGLSVWFIIRVVNVQSNASLESLKTYAEENPCPNYEEFQ